MFSVAALAQNNPTPFDCQFSGTLSTDASSTPTTLVAASTNGTVVSNYQFVSGIVLPGNYYQATNACSGTTTYWIEWH